MSAAIATTDTVHAIITVAGSVLVNLMVLMGAWLKFRTELRSNTREIKAHTDVTVQKLNGMLSYVIHSADRPWWIKVAAEEHGETVFRMLEVNQAYTDLFGISRDDYIGKTDLEAGWSHTESEEFRRNDLLVWATGEPTTFTETVGDAGPMSFRKLRIQTPDGRLKGVMGYATSPCGCHPCTGLTD